MAYNTSEMQSSTSQVDRLADQITSLIVDEDLEAGAKINISLLAGRFGTSVIPVREALARLNVAGMVEFRPNLGYWVADALSNIGVAKLFEARALIELAVAPIIIQTAKPTDIRKLVELNQKIKRSSFSTLSYQRYRPFLELNNLFHSAYVEIAANPFLTRSYRSLCYEMLISRRSIGLDINFGQLSAEHDGIINALKDRSLERLEAAIRGHIDGGAQRFQEAAITDPVAPDLRVEAVRRA